MPGRAFAVFLNILFTSLRSAQAEFGLRATGASANAEMAALQLRMQLSALLGQGDTDSVDRLVELQMMMKPMYDALPKNDQGGLENGAARYAMHRFFVHRHGWHVNGVEVTGSEKWSDASPASMLEGRVPEYVMNMVRERLGHGRLGLQELAMFAATLEDLVHGEAMQMVSDAFTAQNLSVQDDLNEELEELVVKTYMLFHIKPNPNYTKLSPERINHVLRKAPKFLSGWEDTLLWVTDIKNSLEHESRHQQNPFNHDMATPHRFDSVVRLVEAVGEAYGQYQNIECRTMKNALLALEDSEVGRVRLSRFYAPALSSEQGSYVHFSESADYLRHLGALDESDPRRPSVIVPNYMYARSNCLASSKFYSICCINECEDLMAKLESSIAGPSAHPQMIAEAVAATPSDTVVAPRNLSAPLRRRLDEIAMQHGGLIPIHGRLFAQWMHHVFPNECPYPHAPGTVETPMRPAEWMKAIPEARRKARANKEDMKAVVDADDMFNSSVFVEDHVMLLPWTEEEELVSVEQRDQGRCNLAGIVLRFGVLVGMLASAGVGLVRMLRAPLATLPTHKKKGQAGVSRWAETSKSHFV